MISTDMAGDTVMMSVEDGNYFGLSGIGTFLWEQLESPLTIEELVFRVTEKFDVSKETAESDILEFTENLFENEIVLLAD